MLKQDNAETNTKHQSPKAEVELKKSSGEPELSLVEERIFVSVREPPALKRQENEHPICERLS